MAKGSKKGGKKSAAAGVAKVVVKSNSAEALKKALERASVAEKTLKKYKSEARAFHLRQATKLN